VTKSCTHEDRFHIDKSNTNSTECTADPFSNNYLTKKEGRTEALASSRMVLLDDLVQIVLAFT